jgi:hypothetical protein
LGRWRANPYCPALGCHTLIADVDIVTPRR